MMWKRIAKILVVIMLLLFAFWAVVVSFVATPEVITPRIVEIAQSHTKSKVSIKSVDLSLFTRFPNITLRIDSLRIAQQKDSIDDLLFARECRVSVNPLALLAKKIVVSQLAFKDVRSYIYVDSLHGPLKHFTLNPGDSLTLGDALRDSMMMSDSLAGADSLVVAKDEEPQTAESEWDISLKSVRVDSVNITINDRIRDFFTRLTNFDARMSLDISGKSTKLDVNSGFENLLVWHKGEVLVKRTSLRVDSKVHLDLENKNLSFDRADMVLNGIEFNSSGNLHRDTVSGSLLVDVDASLATPSLAEFLELIPSSMIDGKDKISTKGDVALDVNIKGEYTDSLMPRLTAHLKIDDAQAKYASRPLSLEKVNCDALAYIDMNNPAESYVDINRLYINTSNIIDLDVKGKISNPIEAPYINLSMLSHMDFDHFADVLPLGEGLTLSGTNSSDVRAQFAVNDVLNSNFARMVLDGESNFKNLEVIFDASKLSQDTLSTAYLYMQAEHGKMLFGDRVLKDSNSRTLRSTIDFSGIGYKSKAGEYLTIKDIALVVGANFNRATSEINGVGFSGTAKNSVVGIDSLFNSTLESSTLNFLVMPKNKSRDMRVKATIASEHIGVTESSFDSNLALSTVNMELDMTRHAVRDWSVASTIGFTDFKMFTKLFPLDIAIPKSQVSLKDRVIYLNNTHLKIGNSEVVATGDIKNVIRKMFVDPQAKLSGTLSLNAPVLNVPELIAATNSSVMMLDQAFAGADSLAMADSVVVSQVAKAPAVDSLAAPEVATSEAATEPAESPAALLLVPRNVDFTFYLNVDKVVLEETSINNVVGRAKIKDGALTLDELSLQAIGAQAYGAMVYKNIGRNSANVDMDMELMGVDINRIGELSPSLNTMMPMLKSFEGVVDYSLKANTNLTPDAMIDMKTLRGAMSFDGRNLVLMDSETFATLSKMLMFKNKKRNLIDAVQAYVMVRGATVTVLPFEMSMDRYKAIIGGSQVVNPSTFDVNYAYNVSIIKSPLPFKAGVDIGGNLDDFDFKVTKAKLKNTNFDAIRESYIKYRDEIGTHAVTKRKHNDAESEVADSLVVDSLAVDSLVVDSLASKPVIDSL